MKCYYEVLGVERTSTSDEIKKAHRKLALKWHPDKNKDNAEESHKVYQIIQEAYDCLMDPQERAFYDKHREQILRGGTDHKSDEINVMGFYSASCYNGFTDEADGFYAVYADLFVRIIEEDERYDDSDWEETPKFGDSTTEFDLVKQFYGWWQSYCTKKSYVWLDELYDVRQADGRRILRAMEKENKKITDEAKKEFNEHVRSLVTHIKKKDPRCIAQREKQRLADEERSAAEKRRKEEQRKKRAEEIEMLTAREKDKIAEHEEQLEGLMGEYSDSEDDEDPFYCPLCRKLFKSDKMMKQHEKSKKHREKLAELESEFASELQAAGLTTSTQAEEEAPVQSTKKKKKKKKGRQVEEYDMYDLEDLEDQQNNVNEVADALQGCTLEDKLADALKETVPSSEVSVATELAPSLGDAAEVTAAEEVPTNECETVDDVVKSDVVVDDAVKSDVVVDDVVKSDVEVTNGAIEDNTEAACDVITSSTGDEEYTIINTDLGSQPKTAPTGPKEVRCNMCQQHFPSKSKLFVHLKATGHAIKPEFVEKPVPTGNKKSKKGKKREKR